MFYGMMEDIVDIPCDFANIYSRERDHLSGFHYFVMSRFDAYSYDFGLIGSTTTFPQIIHVIHMTRHYN